MAQPRTRKRSASPTEFGARASFLHDFFVKLCRQSHRPAPKKGLGKRCDRQTDRQTDRIRPIWSSSGVVFWTAKSQIPVADASKICPENNTPNSLRNPVNGHLRLASVVALSSSGACALRRKKIPTKKLQKDDFEIEKKTKAPTFCVFLEKI